MDKMDKDEKLIDNTAARYFQFIEARCKLKKIMRDDLVHNFFCYINSIESIYGITEDFLFSLSLKTHLQPEMILALLVMLPKYRNDGASEIFQKIFDLKISISKIRLICDEFLHYFEKEFYAFMISYNPFDSRRLFNDNRELIVTKRESYLLRKYFDDFLSKKIFPSRLCFPSDSSCQSEMPTDAGEKAPLVRTLLKPKK